MLFNSFEYIIFFPIVVAIYFALPHRWRWAFLLAASYYFYMCWRVEYIFLIIASTLVDYYAGLMMGKIREKRKRKKYLVLSIVINLGLLFSFKYLNFFTTSVNEAFHYFNIFHDIPLFKVLLPVGISFYTFQTLSYTIDVYRGRTKTEYHLGKFALYVAFFPQLVAGPIERSYRLLPQFNERKYIDYNRIVSGLKLMLWGFLKKVVVADRLGIFTANVFGNPAAYEGLQIHVASAFLLIQIYADFSGYTDIARGSARIMGYDLMENFKRPFIAKTISEFWGRWHISMTTWFRDYLFYFFPIKKNRKVIRWKWHFYLIITFVIIGIWHGASWTFFIFGLLQGIFITFASLTKKYRFRINRFIGLTKSQSLLNTVNIIVVFAINCFSAVFFGARSIKDAGIMLSNSWQLEHTPRIIKLLLKNHNILIGITLIVFMLLIEYLHSRYNLVRVLNKQKIVIRWSVYLIAVMFILVLGVFSQEAFIYFQF